MEKANIIDKSFGIDNNEIVCTNQFFGATEAKKEAAAAARTMKKKKKKRKMCNS